MRTALAVIAAAVLLLGPAGAAPQWLEWPAPGAPPAEFAALLATLDPARVESVTTARQALETGLRVWNSARAEDGFRAFWRFYRSVVRAPDPSIDTRELVALLENLCRGRACDHYMVRWLETSREPGVATARAANAMLLEPARLVRRHGVEILWAEGNLYRAEDAVMLAAAAQGLPTSAFREFVEFWAREQEVWVADGSILIPWAKLSDRLARWEEFRRGHAELPESRAVVEPEIRRLREFYLCGVANTPVFEHGRPRMITAEALASFRAFPRLHPESETVPMVAGFLREISQSGGVLDATISAYAAQALNNDRTACRR